MSICTRRGFLGSSVGFCAGMGLARTVRADSLGKPDLRFGVLSDIHIREGFSTGLDTELGTETRVRAFRYFEAAGADAVMICGDMADLGTVAQLHHVADAWNLVFPNGRGRDGRKVEKVFVYGNHDMDGFTYGLSGTRAEQEARFAKSIARDPAAAWEECFGEPFAPIYEKSVKGYTFIGCHWDHWKIKAGLDLGQTVADVIKRADPSRPLFYLQHPHLKDTCFGPGAWGHDSGNSTRALAKFPRSVAFSGHAHYSMTDDMAVWQGAFTSIGVGSLSYISTRRCRENGGPWQNYPMARQMNPHDIDAGPSSGRHGLMVSVYGTHLAIERREFSSCESLGEDWVFDLPDGKTPPTYTFASRAVKARKMLPAFPPKAKISLFRQQFKVRGIGGDWKSNQRKQLCLAFPSAMSGGRVLEYDVRVEELLSDYTRILREKRVIAPDYSLPSSKRIAAAYCYFSYPNEVPQSGRCRFTVWPLDAFGNRGTPLVAETDYNAEKLPERKVRLRQ